MSSNGIGRLTGKVAIVTGAGSRGEVVGNGQATAVLFAREGCKVLLVDSEEENFSELDKNIEFLINFIYCKSKYNCCYKHN